MISVAPSETNHFTELLKTKSREAFSSLYDKYSAALFSIICKIVQNTTVAEELLQDVFVKVWKNIEKYDTSKGSLFTWMLNIARNTCIDYLRSNRYKLQLKNVERSPETLAAPNQTAYNAENSEMRGLAVKLDHKYRQIIDLVYFWGYTQEEVAKMLDIPLGTVKTRSRAGLQQLRYLYQNENKFL